MIKTKEKKVPKSRRPQKTKEALIEEYKKIIPDWDIIDDECKEEFLEKAKKLDDIKAYYENQEKPPEYLLDELNELIYVGRGELLSTEPRRPLKTREVLIEECKKRIHDWDILNDADKEAYLEIAKEVDGTEAYCEHPGVPCACCGKEYDEYGTDWTTDLEGSGIKLKICDKCFKNLIKEKVMNLTDSKKITMNFTSFEKTNNKKQNGTKTYEISG